MGESGWQIGFVEKAKTIPELFARLCSQANADIVPIEETQQYAFENTNSFKWPFVTMVLGGSLLFLLLGEGSPFIAGILVLAALGLKLIINRDDPIQPTYKSKAEITLARSDQPVEVEETKMFQVGRATAETVEESRKQIKKLRAKLAGEDNHPCPICAESIKKTAKKCRFCGEWIG